MEIQEVQEKLREEGLDGWLFFDHHGRDPIAYRVLGLGEPGHVSRRWYYWLPAEGEPVKLVHSIESWMLDSLPGRKLLYSRWSDQRGRLGEALGDAVRIAMQYSPECMIPYVSLVDGGTIDLIRSLGKQVLSSASLVQYFEARWSEQQLEMHLEAGRRVDAVLRTSFELIGEQLRASQTVGEFAVAEMIRQGFRDNDLVHADGPIVGVNANSGNPHYTPTKENSAPIRPGDFVLIDLWAKLNRPGAVYYDITWTGYCGETPPSEVQNVFEVVTQARDRALALVDSAVRADRTVRGCEVDDVTREHITTAGYGEAFVHRTGHSIGEEVHGNGANMDNLETQDERPIIPRTCFSIEPGVYLKDFGVRSEIDCYVSAKGARATGRVQTQIVRI